MKILIVPTTDWLGHPFPSRLHHIFEEIAEDNEVHVLRFGFYDEKRLKTQVLVHEIGDVNSKHLALYYTINAIKHFQTVREIVKQYKIDVVVISNLLSGYAAAKAACNLAKLVYDLPDYFPASGTGYYFDVESLPGKIAMSGLEQVLKRTLKLADYTVTCSHTLMNYARLLGISEGSVIPNGVDDFFWRHKYDGRAIREKYELNGCITIGYIGSIEFWLDLYPLLSAIKHLAKDFQVKLFLIGARLRTKTAAGVQREIKTLEIEKNVVWLKDFIPYIDVPEYIAAMDICTIPFNCNNPTAYYSAPNKLLEYLALEKPVITTPIPDAIIQAGRFINVASTSNDYKKTIKEYIRAPEKFEEKAKSAKQFVRDRTWTNIAERYQNILKSVVYSKT